jgi:uncharacterized HAD superfamily protein
MTLKDRIKKTGELIARVAEVPKPPALGLDLDGTIDEATDFFKFLSAMWNGPVFVITYRNDTEGIVRDLKKYDIKYTAIVSVKTFAEKAEIIKDLNVKVFFDDMDEVLMHVAPDVKVFKIRNEGNFDYDTKRWLYSKSTGMEL